LCPAEAKPLKLTPFNKKPKGQSDKNNRNLSRELEGQESAARDSNFVLYETRRSLVNEPMVNGKMQCTGRFVLPFVLKI
jgi:hypothetical protein